MELKIIATGSKGNCYALKAGGEILLLDAGISIRRIITEVPNMREVVGCVVTHEHNDHCAGAEGLARLGVRVMASKGTVESTHLTALKTLHPRLPVQVGNYTVLPFETQHDAAEPFGYVIRYEPTQEVVLYATDTYYLRYRFPGVHYWVVECNYVGEIVDRQFAEGVIDGDLRNRLVKSHMSLQRLKEALRSNDTSAARKIVLVHLSDGRSDEARMVREVQEETGVETVAASAGMTVSFDISPF